MSTGGSSFEDDVIAAGDLITRLTEPQRRYHTLAHVQHMLSVIDELAAAEGLDDNQRQTARLGAWLHDAVYDPTRHDNEQRSADLARATLMQLGVLASLVDEVVRLVALTAHHEVAEGDLVGAVLVDADLAILAGRPDLYDAYASQVRQEYVHVPDEMFRQERAAVLRHLMTKSPLYRTNMAQLQWDRPARHNMEQELAQLSEPA